MISHLETDTKAKERPILFSGPMVRAILDGTKVQTRRVVKLTESGRVARGGRNWHLGDPDAIRACPYGQPGDRLWVRESGWMYGRWYEDGVTSRGRTRYRFDEFGHRVTFERPLAHEMTYQGSVAPGYTFRPSIHMPRWASRITLELTDVRVQRLQEISAEDAVAEGCSALPDNGIALSRFTDLWNSINEKRGYGWDANPWVWALTFKRLEAPSHV